MIKVIAFDLDDTLWDVTPILLRAEAELGDWLRRNVAALEYSVEDMRSLRHQVLEKEPALGGRITELRRRIILEAMLRSGIPESDAERLSNDAIEVFLHARNQIDLFEGALDAIRALSGNYVLGVLTNGNADVRRLGLASYFAFAFSAEDVGAPKPEANLFNAALQATGARPGEMVYVGDDPLLDMDPANRLGINTVWVKRRDDILPGETTPDEVVGHVREVPAAIGRLARVTG